MRCSQRQGFFVVCDVALFANNGAENIGCSLNRDRLPVRLLLLLLLLLVLGATNSSVDSKTAALSIFFL